MTDKFLMSQFNQFNLTGMTAKAIFTVLMFTATIILTGQPPKVTGSVAFTINEKDLIPEGITYDPLTHQFFVSSIKKEKVIAIDEKGIARDFLKTGQDGILQTLGMKVDVQKRRLWVVSNKKDDRGSQSAVHVFNAESGILIKKFIISEKTEHLFNDLALSGEGDAYITDSYSHVIYTVPADLAILKPFAESESFLKGSNGLTVSPDNRILYVATAEGITVINLQTMDIKPINRAENITDSGIDGLVFYKGSLFGVVNSKDHESDMYIAGYKLSNDLVGITGMNIIDKGNPVFNLPTTCVIAGNYLYCLASTSLRIYFQDKNSTDKLNDPIIMKYKIDE
jgi:hypothetical protein